MKSFLKAILGEGWRPKLALILFIYLSVVLWPIVVFGFFKNTVRFDPAAFTQEWLIAISNITIIYIILEYQKYMIELQKRENYCIRTLNRKILSPLRKLCATCLNLKELNQKDVKTFLAEWHKFFKEISSLDLYAFEIEFSDQRLFNLKEEYEIESIDDLMGDFEDEDFVRTINIPALYEKLDSLKKVIETEINNLK